jgi:MarR family transcriptional regulator, organic hydroperoxide resistance regulator
MSAHGIEENSDYPIAIMAKRLLHLFREELEEKLRPHGITAAQLHVIGKLDHEPGISGAKLARACTVTPQTMQVLLRGIERNGWVVRSRHPENERILLARLTPAGQRILAKARVAITQVYAQMLDGVPPKDAHLLESLLSRCVANLNGHETDARPTR